VSRRDVQDLAHVAIGPCPDELITPGLVDSIWDVGQLTLQGRVQG
jgi:hypothetical protein